MNTLRHAAGKVEAILGSRGVILMLGAEPTCVPRNPKGAEWNCEATGPTKLDHARRLASALIRHEFRGGIVVFAPGKLYPGEINPRWALHVVACRDGRPLARVRPGKRKATAATARAVAARIARTLGVAAGPQELRDPWHAGAPVHVLPLDHAASGWESPPWRWPSKSELLHAEGPAGLRLPWDRAKGHGSRRALTVGCREGRIEIFLPPLLQVAWSELVGVVDRCVPPELACDLAGYLPEDAAGDWQSLTLSADPGVLEINLPPCADWAAYDRWLRVLDRAQRAAGLRTWKVARDGREIGTGGGHHLLFGGAQGEEHPFYTRPGWVASILRFWQHHPSLAYLFTGSYVGAASQAPRADESGKSLWDLEMVCRWLEDLPPGADHREAVAGALIHLHSDASGNTHRAEISFDKFWNTRFPGGTRGLIEFRALESLPRVEWASALGLLWRALAAHLLARPFRSALREFGDSLADRWLLPSFLREDFRAVLADLEAGGLALPTKIFQEIWDWRFPLVLRTSDGLTARRALEAWPLLCETPLEGGNTSRFVDTSVERLEFLADEDFVRRHKLRVNGRALPMRPWRDGLYLAGLRYRASAWHPSLHPGMPVQLPLICEIEGKDRRRGFLLRDPGAKFRPSAAKPVRGEPCRRANPGHFCCDLRLP